MTKRLHKQLQEIEKHMQSGDIIVPSVSSKGVYWHLDHACHVVVQITQALKQSKPKDYQPHRSFLKTIIMATGYIPRGKARAPKQTVSDHVITLEDLKKSYEEASKSVKQLPKLAKSKAFKHPLFGWLNLEETIKFMGIHTHHHLKIVRDIYRKG